LLIGLVSLAGRRWGPAVSGWLVGLPLTSGPVALFLALDQGTAFAARVAVGILAGTIAQVAFCLAYSRLAFRVGWQVAVTLSWGMYFVVVAALLEITPPLLPLYMAVIALLAVTVALMPRKLAAVAAEPPPAPWWDVPGRMLVATGFVVALTELAPVLGPHLSGLLAPFPIYATVLGAFTHRGEGADAAARLLRGVVLGLFSFATFFAVVAALVTRAGIAVAFVSATVAAVALQGLSLRAARG
ncbi:MAG TPA: hypothetical protein VFP36_06720, partial [Usitatibacter sp.]|nr:hypothetical protein [Usitatibacter sp.]